VPDTAEESWVISVVYLKNKYSEQSFADNWYFLNQSQHYLYKKLSMNSTSKTVLCVDDDADDRDIVCYTIAQIDPSLKVIHAEDGAAALDYLKKAKEEEALPCLVILDINMPRMDGKQALSEIKKDDQLATLPVVVFSTSSNPTDKMYCERYGVELITKPTTMHMIQDEVKRLLQHCVRA
jgi:CheY-like chemotaxis protein